MIDDGVHKHFTFFDKTTRKVLARGVGAPVGIKKEHDESYPTTAIALVQIKTRQVPNDVEDQTAELEALVN